MLRRLGNFLVETTDDALGRALLVYSITVLTGLIAFAADLLVEKLSPAHSSVLLAAIIGIAFGVITYIEVQAVQHRRRKVYDDLSTVASLNHNVRNALQSIQYAAHLSASSEHVQIINESVGRIDETLRELFPDINQEPPPKIRTKL